MSSSYLSEHTDGMPAEPLLVVRPWLPPLDELQQLLEEVWESRLLTNGGPLLRRLEHALSEHLGLPHLSVVCNATRGITLALRRLKLQGEVITTPFTFVGTAHAIVEAGLSPVMVDIEPDTLGLDPQRVEAAITARTCAIVPVHCYGYSCDVQGLAEVAARHGLPIIYDAAHAFGVRDEGGSVLRHGDSSIVSFHATKVFSTFEGGLVVSPSAEAKTEIDQLANFGFCGDTVDSIGTNAKMSELHAAVGILQLRYIDELIAQRELRDRTYRRLLSDVRGVRALEWPAHQSHNFYSFPILVDEGASVSAAQLLTRLASRGVHARRYFHPLACDFPVYRHAPGAEQALPVARSISSRVLCLPMHPELSLSDQVRVTDAIRAATET